MRATAARGHRAGGVLDLLERTAQGQDRTVVLGIRVEVEQGIATRLGQWRR